MFYSGEVTRGPEEREQKARGEGEVDEETLSLVDPNLPATSTALVQLLQQNTNLRSLTLFAKKGLCIGEQDHFGRKIHHIPTWLGWMGALPESLETLTLDTWWSDRTINFDQDWPTTFPLPVLNRLHSLRFIGVKNRPLSEDPAISLLKACPNLESLEISVSWNHEYPWDHTCLVRTLRKFCPKLTALKIEDSTTDSHFALLIGSCSALGWKSLTIGEGRPRAWKDSEDGFGPLAREALLKHARTLENVRLQSCEGFNSAAIRQLLCTAPRLRQFHVAIGNGTDKVIAPGMSARDFIQSDWICTELESFACRIYDITRPDFVIQSPADGLFHRTIQSMSETLSVQRQIYERLATLTKLRELVLELRNQNEQQFGPTVLLQNGLCIRDSAWLDGPSSLLDSGLDALKSLAVLRTVRIGGLPENLEEAEQQWRWKHWPLARVLPAGEYFEDPVWPPVPDLHWMPSTSTTITPVVYCRGHDDYDSVSDSDSD